MIKGLKAWASNLRRDILALSLAARDPRVPWHAKLIALAVAAYALSPIDLIPDFIPLLGQIDDLILVPIGIWIVVRLIPPAVMADLRERAASMPPGRSTVGLVLVLVLWAAALALITYHAWTVVI